MKTYIVGHKNPDTDSVVSAIALAELKKTMGKDFEAAVAGDLNKETLLALSKFGFTSPALISPDEKKVVLVDHNERDQIHENVKTEEIVGIFDHHKLGGLSTSGPISVTMRPVGSTSTIVYGSYEKNKVEMSAEIAGLLLAGVVSDTLNLTSPTTTDRDREVVATLEKIAAVDVDELATKLFAAKSDISEMSTEELIGKDYKVFSIADKKVGIGVWETVLPVVVLERKEEILEALEAKKNAEGLDYILFAVIDILEQKGDFVVVGEEEEALVEAAFGGSTADSILDCPGVLSRKKQIVPAIEQYLSSSK